jgi:hypothetical protein
MRVRLPSDLMCNDMGHLLEVKVTGLRAETR